MPSLLAWATLFSGVPVAMPASGWRRARRRWRRGSACTRRAAVNVAAGPRREWRVEQLERFAPVGVGKGPCMEFFASLLAMMHGRDSGMSGWMSGWMLIWLLVGLAVLALVVAATVWLVRNMSHGSANPRRELDLRYARGELTSDEYQEQRERLHA